MESSSLEDLCCECLNVTNITVGECENLYFERRYLSVIENGALEEFVQIDKINV